MTVSWTPIQTNKIHELQYSNFSIAFSYNWMTPWPHPELHSRIVTTIQRYKLKWSCFYVPHTVWKFKCRKKWDKKLRGGEDYRARNIGLPRWNRNEWKKYDHDELTLLVTGRNVFFLLVLSRYACSILCRWYIYISSEVWPTLWWSISGIVYLNYQQLDHQIWPFGRDN